MQRGRPSWPITAVVLVGLAFPACADSHEESKVPAAVIEPIAGTELSRVTLTAQAAQRIDLKMEAVRAGVAKGATLIPYAAVLYDPDGHTWVFVRTGQLAFERKPITIDRIDGNVVVLTEGPAVGAKVVTLGATELYGAEIGVGPE